MEETISVANLSRSFNGVLAVNDVSFSVRKGEVLGILGANGAGKTTTIECILGTQKADSGQVAILGLNPTQSRKTLFEKVGVQFQENSFQEKITVGELCNLTQALYRETVDYRELLERFHLTGKVKSLVSELSGGERQRLFVVLALIPNPEVLFLDELTTGLDTKARREVWKYLLELKKEGVTILLSSHFMDEVEALCDRILILKEGNTAFFGTVEEAIRSGDFACFEDAYLAFSGEENIDESF
ncbi:MAG: ABC transporter ATP-binding protein [Clostridiaceae bacterium]|nr:ABC transporter ATP-binding protein [Clostridiaceae bacterium]